MQAIRRVRTMEFRWALAACLGVMVLGTLKGILVAIVLSLAGLIALANNPRVDEIRRKRGTNVFRPRLAGASRGRGDPRPAHRPARGPHLFRQRGASRREDAGPVAEAVAARAAARRFRDPRSRVHRAQDAGRGRGAAARDGRRDCGSPRSTPRRWNWCSARRWRSGWGASGCTSPWSRRSPRSRRGTRRGLNRCQGGAKRRPMQGRKRARAAPRPPESSRRRSTRRSSRSCTSSW